MLLMRNYEQRPQGSYQHVLNCSQGFPVFLSAGHFLCQWNFEHVRIFLFSFCFFPQVFSEVVAGLWNMYMRRQKKQQHFRKCENFFFFNVQMSQIIIET